MEYKIPRFTTVFHSSGYSNTNWTTRFTFLLAMAVKKAKTNLAGHGNALAEALPAVLPTDSIVLLVCACAFRITAYGPSRRNLRLAFLSMASASWHKSYNVRELL